LFSHGSSFTHGAYLTVSGWAGATDRLPMAVGGFNGDGKSDVVVNAYWTGEYLILFSHGSSFTHGAYLTVSGWAGATDRLPMAVGDFNGDGKSDVVVNAYWTGEYSILFSHGSSFTHGAYLTVSGWAGATDRLPM